METETKMDDDSAVTLVTTDVVLPTSETVSSSVEILINVPTLVATKKTIFLRTF